MPWKHIGPKKASKKHRIMILNNCSFIEHCHSCPLCKAEQFLQYKICTGREELFYSEKRHFELSRVKSAAQWFFWPLRSARSYRKWYSLQQKAGFCRQLDVLQLIVLRSDVRGVVVPEGWYMDGTKGMGHHQHLLSEDIKDTVGHEQITSTHTWGNRNSSASKYFCP